MNEQRVLAPAQYCAAEQFGEFARTFEYNVGSVGVLPSIAAAVLEFVTTNLTAGGGMPLPPDRQSWRDVTSSKAPSALSSWQDYKRRLRRCVDRRDDLKCQPGRVIRSGRIRRSNSAALK